MNKIRYMKYFSLISFLALILMTGCMKPVDIDVEVIPDEPNIVDVKVGVMSNTGLLSEFALSKEDINAVNHTVTVWVSTFMSMENIWINVRLEAGCTITPLDGAPDFGTFADFSKPMKYLVTAASGTSAEWLVDIQQDPNMPDISCLADFWSGEGVKALDVTYPDYSPSTVLAVKVDCNHVTLTCDFWGDSGAPMELKLELGEPDPSTFVGSVTLLNDVSFSSWGYDMKYTAGPAGSYDLNTFELTFDAAFEGYKTATSYPFKFYK